MIPIDLGGCLRLFLKDFFILLLSLTSEVIWGFFHNSNWPPRSFRETQILLLIWKCDFFPLIFGLISCPISFWLLLWCYWTSVLTWCRRREWWVVKRNLDHVTFELVVSHNLVDVHNKARMPNLPGNRLPATHLLLRSKILFSSLKWKCEGNHHIVLKIT